MSVLVLRVSCLTLFNLQGARLRASQSPVSAQLLYHSFRSLSRTFFIFFQVLFLAHPLSGTVSRDSFDRIPPLPRFVKHFFHLFALFSFFPCFSPFLHILPLPQPSPSFPLHPYALYGKIVVSAFPPSGAKGPLTLFE